MSTVWSFENGFKRAKKCGFMLKMNEQDQWLLRWFVLQDNLLFYFEKVPEPKLKGSVSMVGVTVAEETKQQKYPHTFKIIAPNKKEYMLAADTAGQKKEWMDAMQQILRLAAWRTQDSNDKWKMEGVSDELQPLFNAKKTGMLTKPNYGGFASWKEWNRRWFALHSDTLYYYAEAPDLTSRGQIPVERCDIEEVIDDAHPFRMKLSVMGRTFHLCAESREEQYSWMAAINPQSIPSAPSDPLRDAVALALSSTTNSFSSPGGGGGGGLASSASVSQMGGSVAGDRLSTRRPSAQLMSIAQATPPKKETLNPGVKLDTPVPGKHTIRIYNEQDLFSTYLIADSTTAQEAVEMVAKKMRIDEDPADFGLFELTDRIFMPRIIDTVKVADVLRGWKDIPNWEDFRLVFKLRKEDDVVAEESKNDTEEAWNVRAMNMFTGSEKMNTDLLVKIGNDNITDLPVNDELAGGDDIDEGSVQDYQVIVHIIEAREIKGMSKAGSSDPIVHVKCMGKVQKTEVFKERANCYFDTVMNFDFSVLPSELFSESLLIEVWDHNLFKDVFIGMHQFDLATIYQSAGHEVFKSWVPITNLGRNKQKDIDKENKKRQKEQEKVAKKAAKEAAKKLGGADDDDDGGGAATAAGAGGDGEEGGGGLKDRGGRTIKETDILGYLQVSVAVLGPGDTMPVHAEEEDEEGGGGGEGDLDSAVLSAPDIKTENYYLNVRAFSGESIFKHDSLGGLSTYVEVRFAGSRAVRSQVASSTSPDWNEELKVPIKVPVGRPLSSDAIYVRIIESKIGIARGRDTVLATAVFSFAEVLKSGWGPKWYNLYGAPARLTSSREVKAMNMGRIPGTEFRGRILVQLNVEKNPNPVVQTKKIAGGKKPKTAQYTMRFDLYEVNGLPSGPNQFEVKLKWGEHRVKSGSCFSLDGAARWAMAFEDVRATFPTEMDQLPDIFINVYKKSLGAHLRIGLLRLKCADLIASGDKGFRHEVKWELLEHDVTSFAYARGDLAGFVLYRLDFGLTANLPRGARPKIIEPEFKKWQFRAHIFQGEDLVVADMNGLSDPYVNISIAGQKGRTPVKEECLNPVWYTTVHFDVELSENLPPPDVSVVVKDYSSFNLAAPMVLGRFTLPMAEVPRVRSLPEPRWFDLYLEKPTDTQGRLMAAFQLIPKELAMEVPLPNLVPNQKAARVEITIIGLRGVPAFQLRELQNPAIEFDMGDRSKSISTKRQVPSGPNSTFLERIEFRETLPVDERYAPVVNVRILDRRGAGLIQYLVGDTAIGLRDHLPWGTTALRKFKRLFIQTLEEELGGEGKLIAPNPKAASIDDDDDDDEDYDNDGRSSKKKNNKSSFNGGDDNYDYDEDEDYDDDEQAGLLGSGKKQQRKKSSSSSSRKGKKKSSSRGSSRYGGDEEEIRLDGLDVEDVEEEGDDEDDDVVDGRSRGGGGGRRGASNSNGTKSWKKPMKRIASGLRNTMNKTGSLRMIASQLRGDPKYSAVSLLTELEKQTAAASAASAAAAAAAAAPAASPLKKGDGKDDSNALDDEEEMGGAGAAGGDNESSDGDVEETGPLARPRILKPLERCPEWFNMPFEEYVIGRLKPLTKPLQKLPAGKLKLHVRVIPVDENSGSSGAAAAITNGDVVTTENEGELTRLPRLGAPLPRELNSTYAPFDCVVRVYLVRGIGLKGMDANGFSDPYCEVSWGKRFEVRVGNGWTRPSRPLRTDVHNRTLNPEFRASFDLKSSLPGNSELEIAVFDHDQFGQNDMIGLTRIDVENRWYSDKWRANNPFTNEWKCDQCGTIFEDVRKDEPFPCPLLANTGCEGTVTNVDMNRKQPLEVRPLRMRGSSAVTGSLECFIEIWGVKASELHPPFDITPPPLEPFELRLAIYEVTDVKSKEGKADLKVTAQLLLKYAGDVTGANENQVETDVHGGSEDGVGRFNWRFVWPLDLPCKIPRLKLQVWDARLLGSNDALGEVNVSLKRHLDKALRAYRKHGEKFQGVVFSDQWLTFRHPNFDGPMGRVRCRMDIVTQQRASQFPVGKGREAPNRHPFLAKPKGRGAARWQLGKRFGKFLGKKFGGAGKTIAIIFCILLLLAIAALAVYLFVFKPGQNPLAAIGIGNAPAATAAAAPASSPAPRSASLEEGELAGGSWFSFF